VRWLQPAEVAREIEPRKYCSRRCSELAGRILTDDDIRGALELRWEGRMWREVGFVLGTSMQTVQSRIWVYLWERDELTVPLLSEIWAPVPGVIVPPSWRWLANRSGIEPRH
jgi:hypothetical protein